MLEFLVENHGMTLSRLAEETGIKPSTLSNILHESLFESGPCPAVEAVWRFHSARSLNTKLPTI